MSLRWAHTHFVVFVMSRLTWFCVLALQLRATAHNCCRLYVNICSVHREVCILTPYTRIFQVGAIPDYQSSDMALYSVSNISSNSSDYTGSDYDTTNMLHSPRQRDQYIYRGRDDAIQNRNARDTQISQSNIKCEGAKANGSAGKCETQGRNSHVLGLT